MFIYHLITFTLKSLNRAVSGETHSLRFRNLLTIMLLLVVFATGSVCFTIGKLYKMLGLKKTG